MLFILTFISLCFCGSAPWSTWWSDLRAGSGRRFLSECQRSRYPDLRSRRCPSDCSSRRRWRCRKSYRRSRGPGSQTEVLVHPDRYRRAERDHCGSHRRTGHQSRSQPQNQSCQNQKHHLRSPKLHPPFNINAYTGTSRFLWIRHLQTGYRQLWGEKLLQENHTSFL